MIRIKKLVKCEQCGEEFPKFKSPICERCRIKYWKKVYYLRHKK